MTYAFRNAMLPVVTTLGMTFSYMLGANVLVVCAGWTAGPLKELHWETLLRARAIETGCYVLAPAQTGFHPERDGKGRRTHGHSLVVAPWGEVVSDAGEAPGVTFADIDLSEVARARGRIPALTHDRPFGPPDA